MSREVASPCPNCGREIKSAGHIMTECLASHRLTNKGADITRLYNKEELDTARLYNKGGQIRTPRPKPETTAPPPLHYPESQKRPSFDRMIVNLRRVPMGQFMRDAAKEMEHLPFVITKDGTDFVIVGSIKGSES